MHEVIKNSVAKLGFKTADIKIMLSSHAHFDHIEGHAMMQKLTGAQVMAMVGDAEALSAGKDNSALGARLGAGKVDPCSSMATRCRWEALRSAQCTRLAIHRERQPGSRPSKTRANRTSWRSSGNDAKRGSTAVRQPEPSERDRGYAADIYYLKARKVTDIYLPGHPHAMFMGKVERIKAGELPTRSSMALHGRSRCRRRSQLPKRVAEERAKAGR